MLIEESAKKRLKPDADGVVIGPMGNVSPVHAAMGARNSMAIRAKLRPLLYEERVDKTNTLLTNYS